MTSLPKNIGVFTDPNHNLWLDEAEPSAADIRSGAALDKGEVVVEIRSSGICGFVGYDNPESEQRNSTHLVLTYISGTMGASDR
jgi:hypothetical protein